ncbi:MAG: hypothetical protein Q9227_004225 [Pyrenula ochraceoflavens]
MPTPESDLFLSKKPKVPPTFNGVDYNDTSAVLAARDSIVREQWVLTMMTRLVGEELGKCYRREGVNHLENCGRFRERYLELIKEHRQKGYRGQQQNFMPGVDGPEIPEEERKGFETKFPTARERMGSKGTVVGRAEWVNVPAEARKEGRVGDLGNYRRDE